MPWKIEFYSAQVEEDIKGWPESIQAKFYKIGELLEKHGPFEVGMPHVENFGQGLFEIRAKGREGIGRIFFGLLPGRTMVLLHAFIKKTQKTPKQELAIAKKRLKEVKTNA